MKSCLKYLICASILILDPCKSGVNAQIMDDSSTISLIKSGIDNIYDLKFDQAYEIYGELKRLYNDHPVVFLYHGMIAYWQNYPLLPSSPSKNVFEEDMRRCIRLSEKKPYSEKYEAEALLANLCARGLLLLFYADNDLSMNVIPVATSTYKYLMLSFDFNTVYSDLCYFTGLYNYYRDAYPRFRPVYKAVAGLFPPGDMTKGLNELNNASKNAIVLRAESNSILSWIYTYYENNYPVALSYTRSLRILYPSNLYFKSLNIKNLLLLQQYDEAEKYLTLSPEESENKYYGAQVKVFCGIIQEKKYLNNVLARRLYEEGLNELTAFGNYGKEYSAFACFGLSRIYVASGDKANGKKYRRKAMDLADFKKVNFD
jgi:hypothetical protein